MKTIADYIDIINSSPTPDALFSEFVKIMHGYGYDQVAYGCATDCPSLGLKKKHGYVSNFPPDWIKHYAQNNLADIDPVHIHLVEKRTPVFWSYCEKKASEQSMQLMRDAADVGLKSGIVIPLCDIKANEICMVSVSRNESPREENYETLAAVNLLSAYFHEGYKSFIKKPTDVDLSPREYEILSWAAEGKNDPDIALLTGISVATVRYHWKNIFRKLDAYNRVYAVSCALQRRLVQPRYVMKKK